MTYSRAILKWQENLNQRRQNHRVGSPWMVHEQTKSSFSKLPLTAPCAGMLRTVPHHLQPPWCPYRCRNRTPFRRHRSGPAGRRTDDACRMMPLQLPGIAAAKAASRLAVAPCHQPNHPSAARVVVHHLTEEVALLSGAAGGRKSRPICWSQNLRKAPAKRRLACTRTCPLLRVHARLCTPTV